MRALTNEEMNFVSGGTRIPPTKTPEQEERERQEQEKIRIRKQHDRNERLRREGIENFRNREGLGPIPLRVLPECIPHFNTDCG